MTQTTELLDAALHYAEMGWHVFPLHTPREDGSCSCRRECGSVGKHPRTRNGVLDASNDPAKIEDWWERWPLANIGIATGPSGLTVIDIDPRHGGEDSWDQFVSKAGHEAVSNVESLTGGGGRHLVYTTPAGAVIANVASSDRFVGALGRGVDVRAAGGYIVAPPSRHASGTRYEWAAGQSPDDARPMRLPGPLLDVLDSSRSTVQHEPGMAVADILGGVGEGQRDWELFRLASKLRYADVPREFAERLVTEAAAACIPPFPRADALRKVASAYDRYEAGKPAIAAEPVSVEGLAERRIDLWPFIEGDLPEPVWVVENAILAGHVHLLYGVPGCGKTILGLAYALQALSEGKHVLFVDEESGVQMTAARLKAMGADKKVRKQLHYFPFAGLTLDDADALVAYVAEHNIALVMFDSMADVLSASHLDENASLDVTRWMMDVAVRIARTDTGAAVVILDHSGKDTTDVSYSRGSGAKKAKSDITWYVSKTADFDVGRMGRIKLSRTKNRVGFLPESITYVAGGEDGVLVCRPLDPSRDVINTLSPSALKAMHMMAEDGGEWTNQRLRDEWSLDGSAGIGDARAKQILAELAAAGKVFRSGRNRGTTYTLIGRVPIPDDSLPIAGMGRLSVVQPPPLGGGLPITDSGPDTRKSVIDLSDPDL